MELVIGARGIRQRQQKDAAVGMTPTHTQTPGSIRREMEEEDASAATVVSSVQGAVKQR